MGLGAAMAFTPGAVILGSRDADEEAHTPTAADVWTTRILGVAICAVSGYGLYALLIGLQGAEMFPA
jgi:hypothetical protein